jgi:hypothetical protein
MDQDSDLENSNNNVLAKHEKMDYASCVAKIKHIYKEKHTALDGLMRSQVCLILEFMTEKVIISGMLK